MTEYSQVIRTRLQLDPNRFVFALRTICAAIIALYLGVVLGLEHPNWAVMSVLSVSQPTRERLLLKGSLRVAGSFVGAVAGVLILLVAGSNGLLTLGLLSVWVALFVAGTILLRGLFSYFSIVCSFTAAMVVLLVSNQPDALWAIGLDRMLTAILGVFVVSALALIWTPKAPVDTALAPLQQALSDLLSLLAGPHDVKQADTLLHELARIEAQLDAKSDSTRRRNRRIGALRRSLSAMLKLVLIHGRLSTPVHTPVIEQIATIKDRLSAGDTLNQTLPALHELAKLAENKAPELASGLWALVAALSDFLDPALQTPPKKTYLHHDWSSARVAFLRVVIAYWLLGLIWVLTGWEAGAYLLISMTVMISVYSAADEPLGLAMQSFLGQIMGVAGALLCVALLWPLSSSVWQATTAIVPLLLMGSLIWSRNNLSIVAYDFLMSMMLILNPNVYQTMGLEQAIPIGIAIFAGPLIVWLVLRILLPLDRQKKASALRKMLQRDVVTMLRRPLTPHQAETWRARLAHRLLRLAQLQQNAGLSTPAIAAEGRAWLELADAVYDWHELTRSAAVDPKLIRAAAEQLGRIGRLQEKQR